MNQESKAFKELEKSMDVVKDLRAKMEKAEREFHDAYIQTLIECQIASKELKALKEEHRG